MLKHLQKTFYVVFGTVIVLVTLWGHLTTGYALILSGVSVVVAYLAFLSLVLRGDKDALLIQMVKSALSFSLRTIRRSIFSNLIVLCICGYFVWKLFTITIEVEIIVSPSEPPIASHLSDQEFAISIQKMNTQANGHPQVYEYKRKLGEPLHLTYPISEKQDSIRVTITHPGYKIFQFAATLKDLASSTRPIQLTPRPLLVVTVRGNESAIDQIRSYRVSAWPAGASGSATKRTLTLKGSPLTGSATFVATNEEDWIVEVQENNPRGRIHYSPAIFLDSRRKAYTVDLTSPAIQWKELGAAPPPEPSRLLLSESVFLGAHGNVPYNEIPSSFLFGGAPSTGPVMLRQGYVVSYNAKLKIPNWVAYRLVKETDDIDSFPNRLRSDPDLDPRISARVQDYLYSELRYDAGNLVSKVDMRRISKEALLESQYLSAIAPQTPMLNRSTWYGLERMAQRYVDATGQAIYIMAGPAFVRPTRESDRDERLVRTIGNGVAIPTHFFRLHIRVFDGRPDVLAFLVPNDIDLDRNPTTYLASLTEVQDATNLKFFPLLAGDKQPDFDYIPNKAWEGP